MNTNKPNVRSSLGKRNSALSFHNNESEHKKDRVCEDFGEEEINVVDMSDGEENAVTSNLTSSASIHYSTNFADHPLDLSIKKSSNQTKRSVSFNFDPTKSSYSSYISKHHDPITSCNDRNNCNQLLANGHCEMTDDNNYPSRTHSVPVELQNEISSLERCKSNSPFYKTASTTRPSVIKNANSSTEPNALDVEEHFRKSLGANISSETSAKVDDHFARALGNMWTSFRRTS